jgi:hypothetical protein
MRPYHFPQCTILIALIICMLLMGFAPGAGSAAERRVLWESREQFVALEPRETAGNNHHPVDIDPGRLRSQLSALRLLPATDEKGIPLFTTESLTTLVEYLQQGLRQATPRQDVTFAVIGLHDVLYGLARQPQVTTGRLFVQDGRLNLIIGLAHREVKDREDRRLYPFTPGSRVVKSSAPWVLQIPPEPPGMVLAQQNWVTIPTDWQTTAGSDAAKPTGQLPHTPSQPVRTPAERLNLLKELFEKQLITHDEYQSKRREILQGL